jgi:hypothetical protein
LLVSGFLYQLKHRADALVELDISSGDFNKHFVHRIQESKVKDALKRMKGGKAMGSDGVPIEIRRSLGYVVIVWLTKLFDLIFR